jgi:hypothetical protein
MIRLLYRLIQGFPVIVAGAGLSMSGSHPLPHTFGFIDRHAIKIYYKVPPRRFWTIRGLAILE